MKIQIVLLTALCTSPLLAQDATPPPPPPPPPAYAPAESLSHHDRHFLETAAFASTNEVALSQLAPDRAASRDAREFARRMVADHTQANNDLAALAAQKGFDISRAVEKGQRDDVGRLAGKTGPDFDRDYAHLMVKAHEDAVALFQDESANGRDPDVVAFANKYLPVLTRHLEHAHMLKQAVDSE